MEVPNFASAAEEVAFWKKRATLLLAEKNDIQKEFDDFMEGSQQLEAELETTIQQNEKQLSRLNQNVEQLKLENESLKKKLQTCLNDLSEKDDEVGALQTEHTKLKKYVTQLEQKNDDLERTNRVVAESVNSFELMLNQAYEKNALLESEVDEKEKLQIKLQRLMDEARDLKQELKVREQKGGGTSDNDGNEDDGTTSRVMNGSATHHETTTAADLGFGKSISTATTATSPSSDPNKNICGSPTSNGNAIASSTRVTAISIIYDLLRRIDRIESKLADWKKISAAATRTSGALDTSASTTELYHASSPNKYQYGSNN
ncbi:nuclear distribution protein nudE-like 1-A [Culicoides brevitarsis]|uniref:nuclear distribution protein nudE-like 1-A n=1 Tax=Culicoides brevitarsis TaxID=469753 RepID=UPI00307C9164